MKYKSKLYHTLYTWDQEVILSVDHSHCTSYEMVVAMATVINMLFVYDRISSSSKKTSVIFNGGIVSTHTLELFIQRKSSIPVFVFCYSHFNLFTCCLQYIYILKSCKQSNKQIRLAINHEIQVQNPPEFAYMIPRDHSFCWLFPLYFIWNDGCHGNSDKHVVCLRQNFK